MAGFSRNLDQQKELQEKKPGLPGKAKLEPPMQIVMDPQDPSLQEVIPVKDVAKPKDQAASDAPLKIVMDESELS
jgi:hypothetical protein